MIHLTILALVTQILMLAIEKMCEAGTFIMIKPTVLATQDIFLRFKFCL
jgi:hypothetical protein